MTCMANNITISNVSVLNNVSNTGKIIQFDLSWQNSWRDSAFGNYDGAWVFFKVKDLDGKWYPLRFTGGDITTPANTTYTIGRGDGSSVAGHVGLFFFRSADGAGTFTSTAIRAGIESYPGTYEVRGFALEMVYIPTGTYFLGDADGVNQGTVNSFHAAGITNPMHIFNSSSFINGGATGGQIVDEIKDPTTTFTGSIFDFPNGYNSFWMMKYELSQGGYRDFLNTLTYDQQVNRFSSVTPPNDLVGQNITGETTFRQFIEIATPGNATTKVPAVVGCDADGDNIFNEITDGEWIVCTRITWADEAAYLDWAGLRPPTELEFEKACRGKDSTVIGEYAWGTNAIHSSVYTFANANTASESITNASGGFLGKGNAYYHLTQSALDFPRCGIFATSTSTRVSSGAGYWGCMELSGSAIENCVTTSSTAGRSFTGKLGDGVLVESTGNANVDFWPGVNGATGLTNTAGAYDGGDGVRWDGGLRGRGGPHITIGTPDVSYLCTSHRGLAWNSGSAIITNTTIRSTYSIRGVRQ